MVTMNGGGTPNPFIENADVTDMDKVGYLLTGGDGGDQQQTLDLPISTRENEAFIIYDIDSKFYVNDGSQGKIETAISTEDGVQAGGETAIDNDSFLFEHEFYYSRAADKAEGFGFESSGYKGVAVPYGQLEVYVEFDTDQQNDGVGANGAIWGTSVEVTDGEMTNLLRQWDR